MSSSSNTNNNNKPRGRSAYSSLPLSSEVLDDDDDRRPIRDTTPLERNDPLTTTTTTTTAPPSTTATSGSSLPSSSSRRNNARSYQRVAVVEDANGAVQSSASSETQTLTSSLAQNSINNNNNNHSSSKSSSDNSSTKTTVVTMMDPLTAAVKAQEDLISITVLDPAQAKFRVSVHPDWNVLEFKRVGEGVHKVPPPSQRLIFRGKMLTDDKTLRDFGIVEPDVIVHLFPKPKVVVASSSFPNSNGMTQQQQQQQQQQASEENGGGAHITRIVLDPREAEQRSSILVLGSEEVMEAQNNVKLFSFMLLIICSMELLTLFTLMLGESDDNRGGGGGGQSYYGSHNHTSMFDDAVDPNSPYPYASSDVPYVPRTWQNTDYIELIISAVGFYVATLGIKATTENTLALARKYLIGTVVVGIAWNAYFFVLNVQDEEKIAQENHQVDQPASDLVTQVLFAILLPGAVWILCCMRAWQFHNLLQEAEQEAAERIRAELDEEQGNGGGSHTNTTSSSSNNAAAAAAAAANESSGISLPHRNVILL